MQVTNDITVLRYFRSQCVATEKTQAMVTGYTLCDSLIPGMAQCVAGLLSQANSCTQARLDWTCSTDQMSSPFPSIRGRNTCLWYTVGGKTSDKNLGQWINIKFYVRLVKVLMKR
jgi:hypothetical protein